MDKRPSSIVEQERRYWRNYWRGTTEWDQVSRRLGPEQRLTLKNWTTLDTVDREQRLLMMLPEEQRGNLPKASERRAWLRLVGASPPLVDTNIERDRAKQLALERYRVLQTTQGPMGEQQEVMRELGMSSRTQIGGE